MPVAPRLSKYPPDTFNELDDDEDRELKAIFHSVFDLEDPLELTLAAEKIDAYVPRYNQEQYKDLCRAIDADDEPIGKIPMNVVDWILADFFVPLAKQILFDHTVGQNKLVGLLLALQSLPKPDWIYPFGPENIWKLHGLGDIAHYVFDGSLHGRAEDPSNISARQEARNFTSWVAILENKRVDDFSIYALWDLRAALEGEFNPDPTTVSLLDFRVPLTADWIIRAGSVLSICDEYFEGAGRGGALWSGKGGFCSERWSLWKTRFSEVGRMGSLSENTRDMAIAAAKAIDWIDEVKG